MSMSDSSKFFFRFYFLLYDAKEPQQLQAWQAHQTTVTGQRVYLGEFKKTQLPACFRLCHLDSSH